MVHSIEKRGKDFESHFIHEEEQAFKAKIIAAKLLGMWAASEMHLSPNESSNYSKKIIDMSVSESNHNSIIEKIHHDLSEKHVPCTKSRLELVFAEKLDEAKANIRK